MLNKKFATSYPLAKNTFSEEEINAAKEVLDSSSLTMGDRVREFEKQFSEWTGAKHALMVNSGSSANLIAIEALIRPTKGEPLLNPGDEVIVPALSWPTTVWPLVQMGLIPVFVDIDPITLAVDLKSVEKSLTPKTKGIFLIHVLGRIAAMKPLMQFCKSKKLVLIEDVCESLGAHENSVHAGNFGVMGTFSCYFSHHISTIEGGVVVTNDAAVFDDLVSKRSHGWSRGRTDQAKWQKESADIDSRFLFITSGFNLRPTEINAAIGLVQLKKLDGMLESRENLAASIHNLVQKHTPWMTLVGSDTLGSKAASKRRARAHSWMTLPFSVAEKSPLDVTKIKNILEEHGIETRPIIAGNLARHPAMKKIAHRNAASLAVSDRLLENGFMIGCHPVGWKDQLDRFEEAFKAIESSLPSAKTR